MTFLFSRVCEIPPLTIASAMDSPGISRTRTMPKEGGIHSRLRHDGASTTLRQV